MTKPENVKHYFLENGIVWEEEFSFKWIKDSWIRQFVSAKPCRNQAILETFRQRIPFTVGEVWETKKVKPMRSPALDMYVRRALKRQQRARRG